eukprot:15039067-Alexandrium_andersonii.AAC.1
MSASLVGSEMCIRDRRSGQRWHRRADLCTTTRAFRLRSRTNLAGVGAVSYTHLTLPTICSV